MLIADLEKYQGILNLVTQNIHLKYLEIENGPPTSSLSSSASCSLFSDPSPSAPKSASKKSPSLLELQKDLLRTEKRKLELEMEVLAVKKGKLEEEIGVLKLQKEKLREEILIMRK